MPRNQTLESMVTKLRAEIGASVSVAAGVASEESLKTTLRRVQQFLYDDYDWPHLNIITSKALSAGQRFYDMPSDLNFDRIQKVRILYGGVYEPVERGIGFDQYSVHDSANNERVDPVYRWDVRFTGTTEQIEVWPLPASAQTLYFEGIQTLPALVSDSHRAVLDDDMIVLFAASEFLARQQSEDANAKLQAAQARYDTLKGQSKTGTYRPIQLGLGSSGLQRSGPTVVRVATNVTSG